MKKIFTYALMILFVIGTVISINAQKLGFVNSTLVVKDMPEVKVAESTLATFKSQLEKRFEQKVAAYTAKYQELQRKERQGELSPKQIQDEAAKLEEERKKLEEEQVELDKQLEAKQKELLDPILAKVNNAINELAKEKELDMVFDATPGIVYVNDSIDLTNEIRTKLGL